MGMYIRACLSFLIKISSRAGLTRKAAAAEHAATMDMEMMEIAIRHLYGLK
jgi:hypothetical protein